MDCTEDHNSPQINLPSFMGLISIKFLVKYSNSNLEKCSKCQKKYLRDYNTASAMLLMHNHGTGRKCENPNCKGDLHDTIINFGENLP